MVAGHPRPIKPHNAAGSVQGSNSALLQSFFAYDSAFNGGVFVAGGNLDGGAIDLIITGAGAGGGPQVNIFNATSGQKLGGFFAFAEGFRGGVRVGSFDRDGDGQDDLVTGAGPGGGPQVNMGSSISRQNVSSFFAFDPDFTGGVFVGGG